MIFLYKERKKKTKIVFWSNEDSMHMQSIYLHMHRLHFIYLFICFYVEQQKCREYENKRKSLKISRI